MDAGDLTCICGRFFDRLAALSKHKRTCRRTQTQLSDLLAKAKNLWTEKQAKKQKLNDPTVVTPVEDPQEPVEAAAAADEETEDLSSNLSIAVRKGQRTRRQPKRLRDLLPHSALDAILDPHLSTPEASKLGTGPSTETAKPHPPDQIAQPSPSDHPMFRLPKDQFGVFRQYYSVAHIEGDPDRRLTLADLSDIQAYGSVSHEENLDPAKNGQYILLPEEYGPYPNKSSFLLAEWYWKGGNQKSRRDFHALLQILTHQDFNSNDLRKTSWTSMGQLLGSSTPNYSKLRIDPDAGWLEEEIEMLVPFHRFESDSGPMMFTAGNLFRRSIISIIKETLAGPDGERFHFDPFELYWQPDADSFQTGSPIRIYGEMYNSRAFAKEYNRLQSSPPEPGCTLPRAVIALMFSSDETHLTQFGENSLWPLYMAFGNISKYLRKRPGSHQFHHVAYFSSLPDDFGEFVRSQTGKAPTDVLTTFCGRELLHIQWGAIFDDEFLEAYAHGFVLQCLDGVTRRLYPRIFTLSADYPEKANLAGIRQLGVHPCPRCLIKLKNVDQMGTHEDRLFRSSNKRRDNQKYRDTIKAARKIIFKKRYAVKGAVDSILDPTSLTGNETAFSKRLSPFRFDVFKASVVDLLHDVEQGSWKAVFIHLIRLLECEDEVQVLELDERQVPSFGRDTIRKFRKNVSEMKRLAGRDFEDMLQCSIPVFEDLLPPPHNDRIMKLLFIFSQWHALAKLRLHTDATLVLLDQGTTQLGEILRDFQTKTCQVYNTMEFEKEMERRLKAAENALKKKQASQNPSDKKDIPPPNESRGGAANDSDVAPVLTQNAQNNSLKPAAQEKADSTIKSKEFSLLTYKFHALGDYVNTIRQFGTTDSYSTESGESEHRRSKSRYARTNKRDFIQQMTEIERREARIRRIREESLAIFATKDLPDLKADLLRGKSGVERYHISDTQSGSDNILDLLRVHHDDPSMKRFLLDLKFHIRPRAYELFGLEPGLLQDTDGGSHESIPIFIQHDRIHHHKVLRLNYTTYDLRRAQDFVNPRTSQSNIMLLANESEHHSAPDEFHPFMYARVLKIFHVNVICTAENTSPNPERIDVLWVRWYQYHKPKADHHLDQISFLPVDHEQAFGFVDPTDIVRCSHIIPAFAKGRKHDIDAMGASHLAEDKLDWNAYYVNRFVDRDMLMRYHPGMGIGHTGSSTLAPRSNKASEQPTSLSAKGERYIIGCNSLESALSPDEWEEIHDLYHNVHLEEEEESEEES